MLNKTVRNIKSDISSRYHFEIIKLINFYMQPYKHFYIGRDVVINCNTKHKGFRGKISDVVFRYNQVLFEIEIKEKFSVYTSTFHLTNVDFI